MTSAAAEALGPKPPAESPAAWQQASNRPRPKPGRVAPRPVVKSSHGYFKAHWLGEHSLPRSYWLNNFLVATPLAMALTGLMSWISVKGDSLQISAIVVLIGFPLLIALNVWCLVGAWRSARNYLQERGLALWGWLARISLVLGTAQLAASVLFGFLPNLGEYAQMARGIDPLGQWALAPAYMVRLIPEGDIGNYSNRSPYPTLHLLREESITRAVESMPDTAAIFESNLDTLARLGIDGWRKLGLKG